MRDSLSLLSRIERPHRPSPRPAAAVTSWKKSRSFFGDILNEYKVKGCVDPHIEYINIVTTRKKRKQGGGPNTSNINDEHLNRCCCCWGAKKKNPKKADQRLSASEFSIFQIINII